jgi:hypothetical protein
MPAPLSAGPRCVHATRRRGHSRRELGRDIREESGSTSRARLSRTASPNCRRTVSTSPGARSRRLCRSRAVPARCHGARQEAADRDDRGQFRTAACRHRRAHVPARRGPFQLLRARAGRRARVVRARRGTHAARADRVRRRREDELDAHTNDQPAWPAPAESLIGLRFA